MLWLQFFYFKPLHIFLVKSEKLYEVRFAHVSRKVGYYWLVLFAADFPSPNLKLLCHILYLQSFKGFYEHSQVKIGQFGCVGVNQSVLLKI